MRIFYELRTFVIKKTPKKIKYMLIEYTEIINKNVSIVSIPPNINQFNKDLSIRG